MKHGIICIETEWQITKRSNRLSLNSEPLMKYISEMYGIPYIYRRVATLGELKYYLEQFKKKEYMNNYSILYFSFHGDTNAIQLEGEKENLQLDALLEIGDNVFENRLVHFSSCRTLLGSPVKAEAFKENSRARILSGYTKSVNSSLSALHDIAYFGEYLTRTKTTAIFNNLKKNFEGLENTLGFVYYK